MSLGGEPLVEDMPLVSIITPSYNRVGFLKTCMDSVCGLDYPNIEHIVIDGGSRDGTIELLEDYQERYPLRWVSEPDAGMYHAINKGLQMAKGDILCYLNTDDAYLPWSVSVAVEALTGETEAVFGDLLVAKKERGRDVSYVQFYPPFTMQRYTWSRTIGQPTVFWKASLYRRIGAFDVNFALIADCEYWLRMGAHGATPKKLEEVLAVQVDHDETLRETRQEVLRQEFESLREQYRSFSKPPRLHLLRRLASSAAWRCSNAELVAGYFLGGRGTRWPRFLGFLRNRRVPLHPSYALLGALPGFSRAKHGLSLLDSDKLITALAASEVAE